MKKGIRGHDVSVKGLKNIAVRCKEMGIEYVQLVLEKSIEDFKQGDFSEEYAIDLKNQLSGLKVAVLGSYINPSCPDEEALKAELDKFKEKIRYASVIKPIVVGTETGIYKEGLTDSEEAYQYLLKNVKELAKEALKYDVCIGIEGVHCFVINSPKKMARLLSDLNMDNVKAIFDPCNLINYENYKNQDEIINEMFDLVGDKIVAVHLKDFVEKDGKISLALPGEGLLNYELILKRIKEKNLDIPFISEEFDEEKAKKAFEFLEKIN